MILWHSWTPSYVMPEHGGLRKQQKVRRARPAWILIHDLAGLQVSLHNFRSTINTIKNFAKEQAEGSGGGMADRRAAAIEG